MGHQVGGVRGRHTGLEHRQHGLVVGRARRARVSGGLRHFADWGHRQRINYFFEILDKMFKFLQPLIDHVLMFFRQQKRIFEALKVDNDNDNKPFLFLILIGWNVFLSFFEFNLLKVWWCGFTFPFIATQGREGGGAWEDSWLLQERRERERERVGSAGINWRRLEVGLADEGIWNNWKRKNLFFVEDLMSKHFWSFIEKIVFVGSTLFLLEEKMKKFKFIVSTNTFFFVEQFCPLSN